jgi:hypothetical protein
MILAKLLVVEVRMVEPAMSVLIELGDGNGREAGISRRQTSSACEVNVHAFLFGAALMVVLDAL